MHEVSICQNIIHLVEEEFGEDQLENVRIIRLKIGLLSCVQPDFLKNVYQLMILDSKLKNSRLEFEKVEVRAECEACNHQFMVEGYVFKCPLCDTPTGRIIQGNELLINQIISEEYSYEETN